MQRGGNGRLARSNKTVARIRSEYMDQYQLQQERNRRRKKRLIQRLVIAGTAMVIIIGVMISYHVKQRALYSEKLEQYEQLQEELTILEQEEKELREEIDLLNDEEYILDIARTKYFLSKEGELIFQIEGEEERAY